MNFLRSLAREWRRSLSAGRLRVARAGWGYTGALAAVAVAAFFSANNLLFLILAAMFSTFLVSGFVSRLGLAGLELDLLLPQHICARRNVRAAVRVKNAKRWMPSFSVHLAGAAESGFHSIVYFPAISGRATLEESVTLNFPRRGVQQERSFQFSTRFPFGFAERREMVTLRHEILIYPCLDPQPGFEELLATVTGEIEARQRGRGHDFYRIRPYEAFESAHHVDWKASAHTGALQVREFAEDRDVRVLMYLDLDAHESEWFEKTVDCCAFLVWRLVEKGVHLRFRTQEFEVSIPREGDVHTILRYLARVSPSSNRPPEGPDDTECLQVVFSANPDRMVSLGWPHPAV